MNEKFVYNHPEKGIINYCLYKNKNGNFYVDFTLTGLRKRLSLKCNKSKYLHSQTIFKIDETIKILDEMGENKLFDLIEWYIGIKKEDPKNKSFEKDQPQRLESLKNFFGDISLNKIGEDEMRRFFRELKMKRNLKPSSMNRWKVCFKAMFKRAVGRKWMEENPMLNIPMDAEQPRERTFSEDELKAIVKVAKQFKDEPFNSFDSNKHFFYYFVLMLIYTGARSSEIAFARWDEIFPTINGEHILKLPAEKSKNKYPRSIAIKKNAFDVLNELKTDPYYPQHSEYIIPGPEKRYNQLFRYEWELIRKILNLKNANIHDLRHTYITLQSLTRTPEEIIRKQSGHRSRVAFARYVNINADDLISHLPDLPKIEIS